MDFHKTKINMTGAEYLKYLEWKKKNHVPFKLSTEWKNALPYFIGCLAGILIISLLLDSLTPLPPAKVWTWAEIGMIFTIMTGIAWMIHGVGFSLIKIR